MSNNDQDSGNNGSEWFRASDDVRKTVIQGIADAPQRFAFEPKEVEYSVINNRAIFEGDIYLGDVPDDDDLPVVDGVGIVGVRFRWPGGLVPYEIHPDLPNKQRVHSAIEHVTNNTRIRFVERTTANQSRYPNYIHFFAGDGCWSSVGMQGGRQRISLSAGCGNGSTIHEILHALGLWHEQSREDRNSHVRINQDNIRPNRLHNFKQHIADGDDLGDYDYDSIMHYGSHAFSRNGLPTIEPLGGQTIGQRNGMSAGDIAAIDALYPIPAALNGTYTIQQKSNNRFVDAHGSADKDFSVVTRTAQNDNTQRWIFTPVSTVYTIQQQSGRRFLDAHQSQGRDFAVVTRTAQNNDTQLWVLNHVPTQISTYTIQQVSSGRFLDAYLRSNKDFGAVTRTAQNNDTQCWVLKPLSGDVYTLQQAVNGRYLDAHQSSDKDFRAVTRTAQNNNTQRWILKPAGMIYTIRQRSSGRFVDAHQGSNNDFSIVTRMAQNNDTQRWLLRHLRGDAYTMQQLSSGRYADAHQNAGNDFSLVTRPRQINNTQRWEIKRV